MLAGGPSDFQGVKGKDKCILFLYSQKNNPAFGLYPTGKQRGRESKLRVISVLWEGEGLFVGILLRQL